nr:MAG TPA: minor tail protein [Caudoviricetes sp.]
MLGDEAQKYYGALREISDNSPLSQPEVFEIAGSLAQSGVASENLVEFTKKANQLKVAFDITTQEAGQFLAKTKEQLGLTKEEMFSFADTINYMSDNTASTASQLVDFSQRVGSVARTANVSKEANIALGATLIATGTEANVAATGIKQLYLELGKGADTKKKANALSFLGINGETLAHDMARDAEGTILSVLEKIKSSHAGDKIGLLTDIFGEQAANSIATLANDTDKLRENLSKAKSEMANGAVEREYAERMKTLGTQLKVAKNQLMNSLADVGLALAPSIKNLLTATKPILENIATWIKQNPKLTSGLMKAIGAFALFNLGMGTILKTGAPMLKFIFTISTTLNKLKAAGGIIEGFSKVFPTLSKMGGLLTNPWILAGAVIIGIFVLLYTKSKWFRDGVNNAVKQIIPHVKELGRLLKEYLGVAMTWISKKSKSAGETMKKVWNTLKPILSVVGKIIKVVIITAIQLVIFRIRSMMADFKLIVTVVKGVFNMVKGIVKAAIGVIKGIFGIYIAFVTGKWNEIPKIAQNAWNMVKSGISSFVEGAKGILNGLFNWFGDKWNALKNLVTNNPITVKVKETWDKVTGGGQGTPQKWTGTNYWEGGLVRVGERGAEMIKIPGQSPFITQSEMLMNLPKGTEILNASRTKNTLRERVNRIKERASTLGSGGSTVIGGDTINITINAGSNSNANDIAREVKRILAEMKNKKERVAFG